MSETRYTTAFAHLFSASASLWAIKAMRSSASPMNFSLGSFGTFLFNSALGILSFGHPEFGGKIRHLYNHSLFLTQCLGLPCIATQIALNYHVPNELAYIHIALSVLPVLAHLCYEKRQNAFLNLVILLNLISVVTFSIVNSNYNGLAMALSYTVNHFVIGTEGRHFEARVPSLDLFMYGLCFFYAFAAKTLLD